MSSPYHIGRDRKQKFLKKVVPSKVFKRHNDVFISSNVNFQVQKKICEDLLDSGIDEIYLHCIGKSINRGIHLALLLIKNSSNAFCYSINTSTIKLIDELHPLFEDSDFKVQNRNNSAIHIKIYRNRSVNWK